MARILVTAKFHANEGGELAAHQIANQLSLLGHDVAVEVLPFKESNIHAALHWRSLPKAMLPLDLRTHGAHRFERAIVDNEFTRNDLKPEVVLDVHTTPAKEYSRPKVRQKDWRSAWLDHNDSIQKVRTGKGRIAQEIVGILERRPANGQPARYSLELPAQTMPLPKGWGAKLKGLKSIDGPQYLQMHKPLNLTRRTAEKIAIGLHVALRKHGIMRAP